ncbi:hypothetical protein [Mesorhizobium sp. KR1-2]|uniref:hypothetical protein n=1 Tax=Mesorhizobium sp. KR1-2 TaxID=3156609 RepID=UPI0032B5EA1D
MIKLASLDVERRERFKTCVHEAAHTVAARKNGLPVKWVSIDPDFIRNDPIAADAGCNAGDPVCMAIASHVLGPIIAQRRLITKAEKEFVLGFGVQVLAGPIAEEVFDPATYDIRTAGGDREQIGSLLAIVLRSEGERKKFFNMIRRETGRFVAAHWIEIMFVAWHLQARRTIHEAEIDGLIAEGRARAEDMKEAA